MKPVRIVVWEWVSGMCILISGFVAGVTMVDAPVLALCFIGAWVPLLTVITIEQRHESERTIERAENAGFEQGAKAMNEAISRVLDARIEKTAKRLNKIADRVGREEV